MPSSQMIVCRPTPWFRFRAGLIFLMFGLFAVLFYIDGSTGYRKDNVTYYLHQCFKTASEAFSEQNADQQLTPAEWREFASAQQVAFPDDTTTLPEGIKLPMPWPEILADYERMKSLQWNQLWLEYSGATGLDSTPPEKPHDARSLREQWVFFYVCSVLAAFALIILVRTSRRSMSADDETLFTQNGRRIPFCEFHRLDLRKWDNKGIAYADYDGPSGKGRVRIDGLTYGGFKKELGAPAEALMQRLRSRFSGELLEYTTIAEPTDSEPVVQEGKRD